MRHQVDLNAKFLSLAENAAERQRWTTFINIYPGRQKLPQPSTGSSYATSYIKSFILENKFPLCILFLTLIYKLNIIHMGVTLAELRLLGRNTQHSQVGYIGH